MSTTTTGSTVNDHTAPPPPPVEDTTSDKWRLTSKKYSEQWTQFKLTSMYADDLITLIQDDLLRAKTILDIGCGTGVFAQAYVRAFPNGITGQTIISSDISPSMMEQAQTSIESQLAETNKSETFATKFVFQLEDGSQLNGIADHSIDIVVSLYGVFLIPDQASTLQSIRRVLTPRTGIFANAAWTKHDQIDPSFGGNLQETFMGLGGMVKQMMMSNSNNTSSSSAAVPPPPSSEIPTMPPAFLQWFEPTTIESNLTAQQYVNVRTYRMFHTMIGRNFNSMFTMCIENPMINAQHLSEEQLHTLKYAFFDLCKIPYRSKEEQDAMIMNYNDDRQNVPFTLWTASNLTVAQMAE